MYIEYKFEKKMTKLENETFNCLQFTTIDTNDYDIISVILEKVEKKIEEEDDEEFKKSGRNLIMRTKQIKTYVNKLMNTENINNEGNEYSKIDIFLNLLKILEEKRDIDRKVYFTYFKNFVNLHTKYNNWVEAGISQLKYIKMLDSVESNKIEINEKIKLYKNCIEYFSKGKDWERCIYVSTFLEKIYLNEECNYNKVSKILLRKAKFYQNMSVSNSRFFPYYYRVIFTGNFDKELKSSEWIYRSRHLEQLNQFMTRLLNSYPNSVIGVIKDGDKDKKYILFIIFDD